MKAKVLERRLDLLKLEGNGFFPSEIVKELSQKYAVTERAVYYDLETKHVWQPVFQEMKTTFLTIVNRHNQLYRKASLSYMQAISPHDKVLALGLMRTLNKDMLDFLRSTGKVNIDSQQVKSESEIEGLLREYESSIRKAAQENIRAESRQEYEDVS